jgi:hypothetical protein
MLNTNGEFLNNSGGALMMEASSTSETSVTLPDYTAQQPKRQPSSAAMLIKFYSLIECTVQNRDSQSFKNVGPHSSFVIDTPAAGL